MSKVPESTQDIGFDEDFFEWEERDDSVSYINHCIAGSLAGVSEHVLLLPFDTIKTHMQVKGGRYGAIATGKDLYKNEGILKFWRGASVLASGCAPAHAAYFSVYEFFKKKLLPKFHDQKDEIYPYAYAITGVFATIVHDSIMTPFDTLKQRKQIAPQHLHRTRTLIRYITKTEGLSALYRGFPITLLTNIPQAAVTVCVNETLKILYRPKDGHNFFTYLFCAAIAGSVSATATIPLDNIKTRLQTQTFYEDSRREINYPKTAQQGVNNIHLSKVASRPFVATNGVAIPSEEVIKVKYQDIISTVKTIMRENGIKGFLRGVFPRVAIYAPSSAISWTTYEMIKKILSKQTVH